MAQIRRMLKPGDVARLEMAAACGCGRAAPRPAFTGRVFGPCGTIVTADGDSAAAVEAAVADAMDDYRRDAFGAVVSYTAPDGGQVQVSRLIPGGC
jgi:hypothetical protein